MGGGIRSLVACGDGVGNVIQATPLIRALVEIGHLVEVYCCGSPRGTEDLLCDLGVVRASVDPVAFAGRRFDHGFRTFCAAWPERASFKWRHNRPHPVSAGLGEARNEFEMARKVGYRGDMPPTSCAHDERASLSQLGKYVAVCDGSKNKPGPFGRSKRYPAMRAAVACALQELGDEWSAVLVGSKDDGVLGDSLAVDMRGRGSLLHQAGIIAGASVFLGNDSGLTHVAAALGVPTVVLFGPSHVSKNLPPANARAILADVDLACRPCIYRKDGKWKTCGHECMVQIDPTVVGAAVAEAARKGRE